MENGNKYSVAAQKAFETVMMGAGINRIGGNELVEIFDAASRTAGWYAEREGVLYRHLTLCEKEIMETAIREAVEGERTAGDPVDTRATGA